MPEEVRSQANFIGVLALALLVVALLFAAFVAWSAMYGSGMP